MTLYKKSIFILLLLLPSFLQAQDARTTNTKVADVMALFPAKDNDQATRLYKELMGLGDEGLMMVASGVRPNGVEEGVPFRFAISVLSHYANKQDKARIEKLYLDALAKAPDDEVRAYFIKNLELVGSDASVPALAGYLKNDKLFDPAAGTLETIGSDKSKEALASALTGTSPKAQVRLVKALGNLKHKPSVAAITPLTKSQDPDLKKEALWALALIGDASSAEVLLEEARKVSFRNDPSEATHSLVEYMHQQDVAGNKDGLRKVSEALLSGTMDESQQHFRLAALKVASKINPAEASKLLSAELTRFGPGYRKQVLNIAKDYAGNAEAVKMWDKAVKKADEQTQGEVLTMLAGANANAGFASSKLLPGLSSKNMYVRASAAEALASTRDKKYAADILAYLLRSTDEKELASARSALLRLTDKDNINIVAKAIPSARPKHQVILLDVLKEKRATGDFETVSKLTTSADTAVRRAAFSALANVSKSENINSLLSLASTNSNEKETKALQAAIISSMTPESSKAVLAAYEKDKVKFLPVLPYVNDKTALQGVISSFYNGSGKEKEVAFTALSNWQNHEAARTLLAIRRDDQLKQYHEQAFAAFVTQVSRSAWPDEQKLLMLREAMPLATSAREKSSVLRAVGSLRTFLALVFVSEYLDDPQVASAASRSAMQIALPTSDARPGLTGVEVRNTLQRMLDKLTGNDSQYERIDITTYLDQMPYTRGFEPIFNGKDLTGWQGLVENPIARSKMSKEELAKKQVVANSKVKENWAVKDGMITFSGDGANLCTVKQYGDFEMVVDWKISRHGDSGIYLRGSPQVQIWDTSRVDAGAQVGSGGLYNNKKNPSKPLVVADNPVGEWNTFNIKMIGDKVTVHLNGVLVVDNVTMENYWDYNLPIFPSEAIELQAHGTDLAFRNIYVKELNTKPYELSKEEKDAGFQVLFNGKDLNNWVGNKEDYVVEDNTIAIYPSEESHGNLSTEKEYSDFIFRFEFQLTPGANNGLGIHTPLEGDAAYEGKEIQILDNTAPVYAKLEPYQYHGSVYGVMTAKRDFLKPVGEWNEQEVHVKGDYIKVTLNGTVILEGDLKKATKNGTLDKKDHPGLKRNKGHISFLGHGSVVKFRNIRIRDLASK